MSGVPPRARTVIKAVWPQTPHRRPPRSAVARLGDPLPGGVAGDDLLDHTAVRALSGDLAGGARLAHAPGRRAVKRYPGPAAAGARGQGQAGDPRAISSAASRSAVSGVP
jgi:hypothetical protein